MSSPPGSNKVIILDGSEGVQAGDYVTVTNLGTTDQTLSTNVVQPTAATAASNQWYAIKVPGPGGDVLQLVPPGHSSYGSQSAGTPVVVPPPQPTSPRTTAPPTASTITSPTSPVIASPSTAPRSDPELKNLPEEFGDFDDQCFLIEKAGSILQTKLAELIPTPPRTQNQPVRHLGDVPGFINNWGSNQKYINKITFSSAGNANQNFFEITPEQTAQLVATAEISLVYYEGGTLIKALPIPIGFNSSLGPTKETMLTSTGQRMESGIQDISVVHEGKDSATEKIARIDVTYLFQDMRTLMGESGTGYTAEVQGLGPVAVNFSKLLEVAPPTIVGKPSITSYLHFDLGWSSHDSLATTLGLGSKRISIKARVIMYTFDFHDDGSIIIKAKYEGGFRSLLKGPQSNILSKVKSDMEIARRQGAGTIYRREAEIRRHHNENFKAVQEEQISLMILKLLLRSHTRFTPSGQIATINDEYTEEQVRAALNHLGGRAPVTAGSALEADIFSNVNRLNDSMIATNQGQRSMGLDDFQGLEGTFFHQRETASADSADTFKGLVGNAKRAARLQFARELSLLRYLALREIVQTTKSKLDIYRGVLTLNQKNSLRDNKGSRNGMRNALDRISGKNFLNTAVTRGKFDRGEVQVIPFVFVGDFLNAILTLPAQTGSTQTVYDLMVESYGMPFKIDLGYMSWTTPFSARYIANFPIYYFPLSLKKLNDFMTREIIAKDKIFYNLGDFIKDLFTKFFDVFFQKCKNESFGQQDGTAPSIDFLYGNERVSDGSSSNYGNLFIYGLKNAVNEHAQATFGKYTHNIRTNKYHFYVGGQDRGILQSLKLQDITDPTMKTAIYNRAYSSANADNVEGEAEDPSIGGWTPVVFSADITTLGCPLFNLGQEVYIDAKQYIPVTARSLRQWKVNGYYAIKRVTHKLTPQSYTTSIYAILNVPDSLKKGIPRELKEQGTVFNETGVESRMTDFQLGHPSGHLATGAHESPQEALDRRIQNGELDAGLTIVNTDPADENVQRNVAHENLLEKTKNIKLEDFQHGKPGSKGNPIKSGWNAPE